MPTERVDEASAHTGWECNVGYQFKRHELRLMTIFYPGVFRRQNEANMGLFMAFCEWRVDEPAGSSG